MFNPLALFDEADATDGDEFVTEVITFDSDDKALTVALVMTDLDGPGAGPTVAVEFTFDGEVWFPQMVVGTDSSTPSGMGNLSVQAPMARFRAVVPDGVVSVSFKAWMYSA